jgi:choline dehydrogenase-like flavoprotein
MEGYEDKYVYGRRAKRHLCSPVSKFIWRKKRLSPWLWLPGRCKAGKAGAADIAELNHGAGFKEAITEPRPMENGLGGFREILPYQENKVTLDKTKKDKWGLNVLAIDCELKENEKKMRKDMQNDAIEMLTAAGVKDVEGWEADGTPGRGIHEMGTARMGKDPKTSVLNGNNQVWDAKNVFVTDGGLYDISCLR